MSITYRPLGKVRDLVQAIGLDISYAYDDLVFSDHSMFILQFENQNDYRLKLFFNTECNKQEAEIVEKKLKAEAKIAKLEIINSGLFELNQIDEKEELEIRFV